VIPGRRIRVLVVDDSAFMRMAIRRALERFSDLEVVGDAGDGGAAPSSPGATTTWSWTARARCASRTPPRCTAAARRRT